MPVRRVRHGSGHLRLTTSRGVGACAYNSGVTEARGPLTGRPWVIWSLFALVYVPSVVANIRGLTGPPGSADVLAYQPARTLFDSFRPAAWGPDPVVERVRRLGLRWSDGRALILGGAGGCVAAATE